MKLSDRVRPDVEAAPWVIGEIIRLEEEIERLNETIILLESKQEKDKPRKHHQYEQDLIDGLYDVDDPDVDHDAIDKACITRLYYRRG